MSTCNDFNIAAIADPFRAQRRKSLRNIAVKIGIAPRAARVVNADRLVVKNYGRGARATLDLAVHRLRRRERDFAEWNPNVGMQLAGDVNFLRIGENRRGVLRFFGTSFRFHRPSGIARDVSRHVG